MSTTTNAPASTVQTPLQSAVGNVQAIYLLNATLTPAQVTANESAEQTFTVNGLLTTDVVQVQKPTTDAGIVIGGSRVSAANTLAINFGNVTTGNLTPTASEVYVITVIRPMQLAINDGFPTTLPTP